MGSQYAGYPYGYNYPTTGMPQSSNLGPSPNMTYQKRGPGQYNQGGPRSNQNPADDQPTRSIWVGNVPPESAEADLMAAFSHVTQ